MCVCVCVCVYVCVCLRERERERGLESFPAFQSPSGPAGGAPDTCGLRRGAAGPRDATSAARARAELHVQIQIEYVPIHREWIGMYWLINTNQYIRGEPLMSPKLWALDLLD